MTSGSVCLDRVSQTSHSFLQLHESSQVVLVLVSGARVTVRVGLERVHINHAFREHQAIVLVRGSCGQGVLLGVAVNAVGLSDATSASFEEGVEQFVQRILLQHLVVELSSAFGVERKALDFADGFPRAGLVPVILGSTGTELHNVVLTVQFVLEIAQVVPKDGIRLVGRVEVDDRVCVKVEHALPQQFQGLVEPQACPAGGESSHENVQVGGKALTVLFHFVMDLHLFFREGTDIADVMLVAVQEPSEGRRVNDLLDLGLVGTLSEFSPHGVQNHLGQRTKPRVVFDLVVLQIDPLVHSEVVDVGLALFLNVAPLWPPTGFGLDFEPGVDVVLEQTCLLLGKVPDLVDGENGVPPFHGFFEFGGAPSPGECPLIVLVMTQPGLVVEGLVKVRFHARLAQGRG